MADFSIVKNDVLPMLSDTLTYSDGTAVNLTGATVKWIMRQLTASAPSTNLAATVVNPAAGMVSYTFTAADTAVAGQFMGKWTVTFSGGQTQSWPTVGYIEVTVEEDLVTPGGARLVGLGEVKDHLRIPASDRIHDNRLTRMIDSVVPVIENITGPILQRNVDEWYDGGLVRLSLRSRPVISVAAVTEYRGPIAYPLTQVPTPDLGTIYSYMFEPPGSVVRRTVGGGMTSFPGGYDMVHVVYTAGYAVVPTNIREGALELIRVNYQQTEQGVRPAFGSGGSVDDDLRGTLMLGFFVPGRVRELLAPSRRHPSIA